MKRLGLVAFAVIWFTLGFFTFRFYGTNVVKFPDGTSLLFYQPSGGWCDSKTEDWGPQFGTETHVDATKCRIRIRWWPKPPAPKAISHGVQDAQEVH